MKMLTILKLITSSLLVLSALQQIFTKDTWAFIQNVNLIFHEAGHVIFIFFGETLYILGGSILEITIPLIVTVHFVWTKQFFSAAVTCWWLATALLSVSIYASDARERVLPLITNDISTHDWFNLLNNHNLLKYDDVIGFIFWGLALGSTFMIIFFVSKDKDVLRISSRDT
ncbi:hypothetical protein KC851_03615 [Candidatus Kaiserbacteria bacterium]|nr:hypothetical protein [Candidatus Kaiserbacteria bacterium]